MRDDKKLGSGAPSIDVDGELTATDEPGVFTHYELPYAPGGARRLAELATVEDLGPDGDYVLTPAGEP